MQIRRATALDSTAIAVLVRKHSATLVTDPQAAEAFWNSMSEAAHRQNIADPKFQYYLGEEGGSMLGYIALRNGTHLFNFFVEPSRMRQGVGAKLWRYLCAVVVSPQVSVITVNASVNSVSVYEALGFKAVAPVSTTHGVSYVPMLRSLEPRAA